MLRPSGAVTGALHPAAVVPDLTPEVPLRHGTMGGGSSVMGRGLRMPAAVVPGVMVPIAVTISRRAAMGAMIATVRTPVVVGPMVAVSGAIPMDDSRPGLEVYGMGIRDGRQRQQRAEREPDGGVAVAVMVMVPAPRLRRSDHGEGESEDGDRRTHYATHVLILPCCAARRMRPPDGSSGSSRILTRPARVSRRTRPGRRVVSRYGFALTSRGSKTDVGRVGAARQPETCTLDVLNAPIPDHRFPEGRSPVSVK